jgi:CRP-like cAMP-binding protein
MLQPIQSSIRNSLLAALSEGDFALIEPHLTLVMLQKGEVLAEPYQPIENVYFPETALGSVVAISPEGCRAEVHMFGCEGMSSLAVIHDTDRSPHQTVIQVEGKALRITTQAFQDAMDQSQSLVGLMMRYAQVAFIQSTHTAMSNANHIVDERLARWLLMCHDRCPSDEMPLTHEFLSIMLAIRRPSVTGALHSLEGMKLIRAYRGRVVVRDRQGLEDFARDAYGTPEAEYRRLVGPMPKAKELAEAARRRESSQKQIDALKLDNYPDE